MRSISRWAMVAVALGLAGPVAANEPMDGDEASRMHGDKMGHEQMGAADMIRDWPEVSRQAARELMQKYGEPDEKTARMLIWRDNGPWKRSIVHRDPVAHSFPRPHQDVLEQVIDYRVPAEYADDLALYDGSVIIDRTAGELTARCDSEAMNFLALNLADDIVKGEKTVAEARLEYGRAALQQMAGDSPDLTQGLQFEPPSRTAFRDAPVIQGNRVTTSGIEERQLRPVDLEKGLEGEEEPGVRPVERERQIEPTPDLDERTETPRTDEPRIEEEPIEPEI